MKYRLLSKYKYGLMIAYKIELDLPDASQVNKQINSYIKLKDGVLTIKKHYAWDGSSVPLKNYFKWIWDADKYCKIASLVHDSLCQLVRENLLSKKHKEFIDSIYRRMCIEGGMRKWQANLRYKALRKFGDKYIKPLKNPKGSILEA